MKPRYFLTIIAILASVWLVNAVDTPSPTIKKQSSGRWQVSSVASSTTIDGKPVNRSENTILLDSETGKTWVLWPTRDTPAGYSWIELTQRTDAPKAE